MSADHPSPELQEAMELLGQDPLPPNAGERLAELEERAPRSERRLFADLWEALTVASGLSGQGED